MDLRSPGAILLVSCYELGHQPLCVASPLGFLERAGYAPDALDIAVEKFDTDKIARARFIAISVPMHTALRLGLRVAERVREINPDAVICFYGLYAALNSDYLLEHGGDYCIGGEIETPLVSLVERLQSQNGATRNGNGRQADGSAQYAKHNAPVVDVEGITQRDAPSRPYIKRLPFAPPSRTPLPTLDQYARLEHNGESRVTGYAEASRGCLHLCTHCPIPPVYDGRFFVMPKEIVLEDIRGQVRAGATHITFGDPDFLNGPGHALRVIQAMHAEFPDLTFDITTKVEHILKRGEILPDLGRLGCLFAISAVESVSDRVLEILEKNHTRADMVEAVQVLRDAGIAPRPTWVAFTPWTSLGDYLDMLAFIEENDLIDNVDPVQYTIRLLVPPGSYILNRAEMKPHLGELDQASFSYRWTHPDPRMDRLHKEVTKLVEQDATNGVDPGETFYKVWSLAAGRKAGFVQLDLDPNRQRAPRMSEPWFC